MNPRNREMRTLMEAGDVIMMWRSVALLGFLAALMVGNLPGSAEAGWGGCYRSPCYPRYYRPYYPRYYGGCGGCGYRGYVGCGGCGYGGGSIGCGGCGY